MSTWETRMNKARKLRKKGSEVLYERVQLLCQCYLDSEFRAWCDVQGVNDIDYLDNEVADTATTFMTLKAVLDAYPNREAWVTNNIRELIAEIIESRRSERKVKRISWKERALAAERECEKLRAENARLQETLASVSGASWVA